ncbi:TPA: hypothetical protein EYP38_03415 [Candidatus Micrarchaeota archaeon]|nr:hypothetical protein [Candidatus Micrarchaeota archaeon]
MIGFQLRTHPDVLFCYTNNYLELISRVDNKGDHPLWAEADVKVPEKLSLSPDNELRKGRVRVGIVNTKEFLEKGVRVYANKYTAPQMYKCDVTLYIYNKDGIIESRLEKSLNVRCERKKEEAL